MSSGVVFQRQMTVYRVEPQQKLVVSYDGRQRELLVLSVEVSTGPQGFVHVSLVGVDCGSESMSRLVWWMSGDGVVHPNHFVPPKLVSDVIVEHSQSAETVVPVFVGV